MPSSKPLLCESRASFSARGCQFQRQQSELVSRSTFPRFRCTAIYGSARATTKLPLLSRICSYCLNHVYLIPDQSLPPLLESCTMAPPNGIKDSYQSAKMVPQYDMSNLRLFSFREQQSSYRPNMHGLQESLEWRPQEASAGQRQLNKRLRVTMAATAPILTAHPAKGILQVPVGQDEQEQGMQIEGQSERNAILTAAQDDSTNPRHQSQAQKTDAQQSNH